MRRIMSALGFATLLLAACHSNGPTSTTMPDPMMYRASPALHARGNRSAMSSASAACASGTGMRATPSACASAR